MAGTKAAVLVAVMAIVTLLLRALPFMVFGGKRETPRHILYLGEVLPPAIMSMLVVYCLRETNFTAAPFGLPEVIAAAAVVGLHVWKRNALISILGGTVLYMVLVQMVFV